MSVAATSAQPFTFPWRTLKWIVGVLAVLALAGAIAKWATARPAPAVRYETATVDRGPLAAKVTATGNVSALVTVLVGSQVSGRIDSLHADFESQVHAGQTIATIEPSFFRAAVAEANANLASAKAGLVRARAHTEQAKKDRDRAHMLVKQKLISVQDDDAATATATAAEADEAAANAQIAQARATLDQAALNLRYTTIVSPIDGVVISRNVDVGQTVAAAFQAPTLFTIAQDLTRMQVDTNVAEGDVGKLSSGMKVSFTVDAYPNHPFEGTVRQVRDNATMLQNVVTYDAVIDVDNSERKLKPGMTATVTFTHDHRADVLRLPNGALRFKPDSATLAAMGMKPPAVNGDERVVWVLHGERAEPRVVRIGITDGVVSEVVGGDLQPNDRVVVEAITNSNRK